MGGREGGGNESNEMHALSMPDEDLTKNFNGWALSFCFVVLLFFFFKYLIGTVRKN